MKKALLTVITLLASSVFAESQYLDKLNLYKCGGKVELRKVDNGDLALQFEGQINRYQCSDLRFVDASSGKVIKSYDFKGSNYTLSENQRDSLSTDCKVKVELYNNYSVQETFEVTLGWLCVVNKIFKTNPYSYDVSEKGNCKLNVYGKYSKLVNDAFCAPIKGDKDAVVKYEYSQKGNCKVMVNGQYANKNVDEYYCEVTH